MPITASTFFDEGKTIFRGRRKETRHQRALHRDLDMFRAFFGTWPCICVELWNCIDPYLTISRKSKVVHLLWALLLLCCNATEPVNAALTGVDEDTFRKWALPWIPPISALSMELIDFSNQFMGKWHYWTFCVDGIHCPIEERRRPFWKGWWSHKFNAAGVSYELATAATTGHIIWINGPFPCARWPDHKIYAIGLAKLVRKDIEKGVCDAGYHGCGKRGLFLHFWRTKRAIKDKVPRNDLHEYIRARHKQTNSRLHRFNALSVPFRHDIELHQDFFYASVVIVQLEIKHGFAQQFDIVPRPWTAFDEDHYRPTLPDVSEQA